MGTWELCNFKGFTAYSLGIKDRPTSIAADLGNSVHKGLELLALKKWAEQKGEATFSEDETGGTWSVSTFEPEEAFEAGWNLYKTKCPQWDWDEKTHKKAKKWLYLVLNYNDGMFSPLKRTIIRPEQFFDFEIEEPWASYSYTSPWGGPPIEGKLRVRGTMDLVVEMEWQKGAIEYIDWKTGKYARTNWKKRRKKTYKETSDDMQLRLYHLALRKAYPDASQILMSIFYTQDGGPYSIPLGDDSIPETLNKIRKVFTEMKEASYPARIPRDDFKCRFCSYSQDKWEGTNVPICDYLHNELKTLGMEKVYQKHGDKNAGSTYTGGGRANVTVEKGETK